MKSHLITLTLAGLLASASAFAYDTEEQSGAATVTEFTYIAAAPSAPSAPQSDHRLEMWNRMEAAQQPSAASEPDTSSLPYVIGSNDCPM